MEQLMFEFVDAFDFVQLQKCATGECVDGGGFRCRHGDYGFWWRLRVVPKDKWEGKETFGLYLMLVDCPGSIVVNVDMFAGNKKIYYRLGNHHYDRSLGLGSAKFLPTVASLQERGLVVDGVVKFGVKIVLKASDFDPFTWLPARSLAPYTSPVVRQLFDKLDTDDHSGTDFIIVVGEGDTRNELHINRLAFRGVVPLFDQNQEGVLHLPTHTTDAVIEVFRFLYLNEFGVDLTRFLPSLFNLAVQWKLDPLVVEIKRMMILKLQADRSNTDLAASYFDLIACCEVVTNVSACILMDNWTTFLASPNDDVVMEFVKAQVALTMASVARYKGVFTGMDPLRSLPSSSLTPYASPVGRQLFDQLDTADHFGTDFVIAVGDGETTRNLHVYRLALRVVPFFDRMFDNPAWKENQEGVLSLPMYTVDVVIEALRFVYLNEVGEDLTRFLPSLLSLSSEWQLDGLMTAIESDMIKKLQADRCHTDYELAATYLKLADLYDRKVVGRLAIRKLIASWPRFFHSMKAADMEERLQDKVTRAMAAIATGTPIDDGD